jgi:IS1 family transposase
MWSFVGRKPHPRWLWEALYHQTGRIVVYTFGRRADRALVKLKVLLASLGIRHFYTDGRGAYRRHLDPQLHVVGKRRTQQQERKHRGWQTENATAHAAYADQTLGEKNHLLFQIRPAARHRHWAVHQSV